LLDTKHGVMQIKATVNLLLEDARLTVSFVGLEVSAEAMAQLPDELRGAGLGAVIIHNGSGEKQWIQNYLEVAPHALNRSI